MAKKYKTPAQYNAAHKKVGDIYRGRTKYIDLETKPERDYVVVSDNGQNQKVSKIKSIKKIDETGKNADPALVEINHVRYGLEKRSGVDYEVFDTNRMSHKPLTVDDKKVFPDVKPIGKLGSHDLHRVLKHIKK